MKTKSIYQRKIRFREDTPVIVIPAPIAKSLGFHSGEFREDGILVSRMLNSKGDKAEVYCWLDSKNTIKIQDILTPLPHTNGIVLKENFNRHGGSCEFSIPWSMRTTFEILNKKLQKVKIILNDQTIEITLLND